MQQDKSVTRWWALTLMAAGVALGLAYASRHGMAAQLYAVLALCVTHLALMAWIALDKRFAELSMQQVLVTSILLAALALFAQPLLEDDHFRYLWDGYITATTGQPYALAPSAYFANEATPLVMQDVLSGINNPDVPTIYGPVLQALFALCYWLAPASLWPFKLVLLCALLGILLLLHSAGLQPRWLMLFALHPLVFKESTLTAHPDLLIGLALLAGVLAWRRGWYGWAGAMASVAVGMKFSAMAVLPFFCIDRHGRLSRNGIAAASLTLFLMYAPAGLFSAMGEGRALAIFGKQWTFNPLFFKLGSALLGDTMARRVVLTLFILAWTLIFMRWIHQLRASNCKPFPDGNESVPIPPIVAVFLVLLLLSPVVNPWYWLWLLPLAVLRFSWLAWIAATASLLAYAHVLQVVMQGSSIINFAVPLWATLAQILAVAIVLGLAIANKKITLAMSRRTAYSINSKFRRWAWAMGLCIAVGLALVGYTQWLQKPSWNQIDHWIDLRFSDVSSISTAQLSAMLESAPSPTRKPWLILDVRTAQEFAVSHLPGARQVDADQILDFAERELAKLDRSSPIVVYCSVGVRSAAAARDLQLEGFTQVKNLRGSIFQWANEGRALEGGAQVHPYNAQWGQLLRADLRSQ